MIISNNKKISKVYYGNKQIHAMYRGNILVYINLDIKFDTSSVKQLDIMNINAIDSLHLI